MTGATNGPLRRYVDQDRGRAKFSVTVPAPRPLPHVDRLLAEPNTHRTTLGSNQLWQIGLLELWLQRHGIR